MSAASTGSQPRRQRTDGERSRQTILRAAASLATVDGLEGISIGDLAAHTGMSKSGLYAHFGSKEELQLATVETAQEIFDTEVVAPTQTIVDPLQRLQQLCDRFLAYVERRIFPGGCFFASTAAEFGAHPGPVREKVALVQRAWRKLLEHLIHEAQAAGSLDATEAPSQLAFELHAYLLMGNTAFVLHNDPAALEQTRVATTNRLSRATRRSSN